MKQIFLILSLLFVLTTVVNACANKHAPKKHPCAVVDENEEEEEEFEYNEVRLCVLKEVPKAFIPVSQTPISVKQVLIKHSILPVFNSSICQEFPNTEIIDAGGQSITVVDPNSFTLCIKLRKLFLGSNSIEKLAPGTFEQNKFLTHLWLYSNSLEELDNELFENQRYLEHLYLSSNSLKSFPPELFKSLRNLQVLTLHNNELEDLDAAEIIKSMPYLKEVQIRHNQFDCKKLKVMLRIFEEHNIWLGTQGGEVDKYEYNYVKGFECARTSIHKKIYVKKCGCLITEGPNAGKRKCTIEERVILVN